jgi:hypothetical protein
MNHLTALLYVSLQPQELHQQWEALQTDRSLLMQQLSMEQEGLKAQHTKVGEAR